MVRHKRNSFGDTGTSLSCSLCSLFFFPTCSVHLSRLPWPKDPVLFYWFMGFFSRGPPSRTSERADCESPLFSLPPIRSDPHKRSVEKGGERQKERERERNGERGRNNKKEQMPAAIKTTESIKNFRPFTAELPRRSTVEYMREKSTTTITMYQRCFALR